MAISEEHKRFVQALVMSGDPKISDFVLIECREKSTGKIQTLLALHLELEEGEKTFFPIAVMIEDVFRGQALYEPPDPDNPGSFLSSEDVLDAEELEEKTE